MNFKWEVGSPKRMTDYKYTVIIKGCFNNIESYMDKGILSSYCSLCPTMVF